MNRNRAAYGFLSFTRRTQKLGISCLPIAGMELCIKALQPLLRLRMPNGEEFELQKKKRPRLVFCQPEDELPECGQVPFNTCRLRQKLIHLHSVALRFMFHESKENVFLALEVCVDRAFRSTVESSNLAQLGAFVPVAHKDRLGSVKQKLSRFPGSQFVLAYFRRRHLSRLYLSQDPPPCGHLGRRPPERQQLLDDVIRPPAIDNDRRISGEQFRSFLQHWLSRILSSRKHSASQSSLRHCPRRWCSPIRRAPSP